MTTASIRRTDRRVRRERAWLWYAPHPRLRSPAAIERAASIARRILTQRVLEPKPDEQSLFVALHTCAYQAVRATKGSVPSSTRRRRWLQHWRIIREYIVTENLGLVYTMVSRFRAKDFDRDDLLSEAMFALARAVARFDPWRGFRFSTYACNVIARSLMRRGKVHARYRRLFPVQSEGPFDQVEREDAGADIYVERLQRTMQRNLGDLSRMESRVLASRFPANRGLPLTFRQVGRAVGLSKERVRQIQNVALGKLRDALRADPLLS
ncbi:MAG TPA: sigma-70 family RNA polymerase sigma factor [Phycisphaerae bacterium]|nr:sigma-70 family RNA polymerase sigma factor [Phycisphaerae bacterium]